MQVLWLTEEDVISLLTMDDALNAVTSAFREQGLGMTQMPPKSYLDFPTHGGDLRTMPAYLVNEDIAGVKIVNSHPGNIDSGYPAVMALVILNSPSNGAPLALMGATYLTAMRTGAAGGIAADHLARAESSIVGLIGAGVQARTQLLALSRRFSVKKAIVFDISQSRAEAYVQTCRSFLDCEYSIVKEVRDACNCDILVTTTPSRRPLVKYEWILPGTHINAIGADAKGKQELESAILSRAKVVVDDRSQAIHSGEVNVPISRGDYSASEICAEIGEIVAGKASARSSDDDITIFDSTGLAIQDVAVAWRIFKKAKLLGKGQPLNFI